MDKSNNQKNCKHDRESVSYTHLDVYKRQDIEEQAQERFERIVEQMKQAQGAGDYRIVKGR